LDTSLFSPESSFKNSAVKVPPISLFSALAQREKCTHRLRGGEGGIRTPGTGFSPYNGLANRRLKPLGHLSDIFPVAGKVGRELLDHLIIAEAFSRSAEMLGLKEKPAAEVFPFCGFLVLIL
jgi:hypothetical protein